jgi:hypothetical protein
LRTRGGDSSGEVSQEIRSFGTTSDELLALHEWLTSLAVTHVAIEATGVYWKPVYYVLEDAFRMVLVNPAEVKQLPGRKTDVSDWPGWPSCLSTGCCGPVLSRRLRLESCVIWSAIAPALKATTPAWPTGCTRCCRTPISSSPV